MSKAPMKDPRLSLFMRLDIELDDGSTQSIVTDPTWQVVPPGFVTSTGADMTVTDSGAAGQPRRFYRVEAANP